jgi:dihydrodipicolinate synthase/N-acetylneuraminate lyase
MLDATTHLKPRRRPWGISAILLPFQEDGSIDWVGFRGHVERTLAAGLAPAINMDTGFGNLIDSETKHQALAITREAAGSREFVSGAFVGDQPGAVFDADAYIRVMDQIQHFGGTPVIFQSYGLTHQPGPEIVRSYERLGKNCSRMIAFELGQQFAPFGAIYDLETYAGLLRVKPIIGAKHSSLHREPEWQRLELRDRVRPDFHVFTGNDLAIDMIMYGSDYLLGLSTFYPELFARRDEYWAAGDHRFYELNDLLQYLGFLAFRPPVPAYKHSAAMFLKLRNVIASDRTHPRSPERPESDRAILADILNRLESF